MQTGAVLKGIGTDLLHGIRDLDRGDVRAVLKGACLDVGHTLTDHDLPDGFCLIRPWCVSREERDVAHGAVVPDGQGAVLADVPLQIGVPVNRRRYCIGSEGTRLCEQDSGAERSGKQLVGSFHSKHSSQNVLNIPAGAEAGQEQSRRSVPWGTKTYHVIRLL